MQKFFKVSIRFKITYAQLFQKNEGNICPFYTIIGSPAPPPPVSTMLIVGTVNEVSFRTKYQSANSCNKNDDQV